MIALLIFLLVLLLPVPIKTSAFYSEKHIDIYIYKYRIKERKAKRKLYKNLDLHHRRERLIYISKVLIYVLRRNSFKPHIKLNINFKYGLEDAANTAEFYGLLNLINPVIYKYLKEVFIVKNFDFKIHPIFNKTYLKFNVISIIFINLLTILYVIAIFSIKYKTEKKFAKA